MAGSYFCFCYVVSIRSTEGLMAGVKEFGEKSHDHVVIPLLGQVKGEDHTRQHLIHCVNETSSKIPVRKRISRLSTIQTIMNRDKGPSFVNSTSGSQSTTSEMNDLFLDLLMEIYED